MNKKEQIAQEESAKAELLTLIKPGDTVYTALQNVSSSGMSRRITVYVMAESRADKKPFIRNITWLVAKACGFRYNQDKESLVVGGCGMDMGYHVAYSLASVLFRNNFLCVGQNCPSNDHVNGDKEGYKVGHKHSDGGYAINHKWL